jgi:hypothetical protein
VSDLIAALKYQDRLLTAYAAAASAKVASVSDDPEEVDISTLHPSSNRSAQPAGSDFASALRQMQQQQQGPQDFGFGGGSEDPMMKMMQQMMGGAGLGGDGAGGAPPQLPAALQAMLGGAGGGGAAGGQQEAQTTATNSTTYVWKLVHAIFAFILATYIALTSTFNGTKLARSQSVYSDEAGYGLGPRLFIIFTSAELVLQSTRYFMERGQLQGGGMLAKIANSGFLPQQYANYVRILGRYLTIAQTIFSDAMVIVFVFGCLAWWNNLTLTTENITTEVIAPAA